MYTRAVKFFHKNIIFYCAFSLFSQTEDATSVLDEETGDETPSTSLGGTPTRDFSVSTQATKLLSSEKADTASLSSQDSHLSHEFRRQERSNELSILCYAYFLLCFRLHVLDRFDFDIFLVKDVLLSW